MVTKEEILEEIRRTAKENSGKPLGRVSFEKETGIKPYEWGIYFARFGDAQKEAGFAPNQFIRVAYTDEFLIKKMIELVRKLGKFPTSREIRVERMSGMELPNESAFLRLGTRKQRAQKIMEYCKTRNTYDDITQICEFALEISDQEVNVDADRTNREFGEVYLMRSGRYYKIGKTHDVVRRGSEIRIQLPEKMALIHAIKTDDPSGVESYWHRRFESRRMRGEWFNLSSADVKAFKQWRKII